MKWLTKQDLEKRECVAEEFKGYREKIGTQKKVANLLNTFRENIKRWENGVNAIPFSYYYKLLRLNNFPYIDILNRLTRKEVLFGKGAVRQYVKLPTIFKQSDMDVFKYMNPTTDKVIIKSYGVDDRGHKTELFNKIRQIFNIGVIKDASSYIVCSTLISSFLAKFYNYNYSWSPLSNEETSHLKKQWSII